MTFVHLAFVVDFVVNNASLDLSSGSVAPVLEDFAATSYMCPKAGLGLVARAPESAALLDMKHATRIPSETSAASTSQSSLVLGPM